MAAGKKSPQRSTKKLPKARGTSSRPTTKPGRVKPPISAATASAALKKYAAKQEVKIELTYEQMTALRNQLRPDPDSPLDPRSPFRIKFVVPGRPDPFADFHVASCAYWSDTCCA